MKPLSMLGMTVLALAGCKESKEQAAGGPASAKPSKMGERPAKQSAAAKANLPYPEGLKLIETAEKTSGVLTSYMRTHKGLLVPDISKNIGQKNRQPQAESPPSEEDGQVKAEVVEARKAHMAAMVALTRYQGSEFEEEQIKAFQERHRLRQQVRALEDRLNAATAPDGLATEDALQGELADRKKTLEDMEAAWKEVSTGGWRDHAEPAPE